MSMLWRPATLVKVRFLLRAPGIAEKGSGR
jgi:hypothetical protein